VPYLGGVLCAERTSEHNTFYQEDKEAVFWSTPEECAQKCANLLSDSKLLYRIATDGQARCIRNRTTNECVLEDIVEKAGFGMKLRQRVGKRC
jgi:hypothetical protein